VDLTGWGNCWLRFEKTGANEQSLNNRGKREIELQNKGSSTIVPLIKQQAHASP